MITELAEGDLLQILEDDKTLPEPEVIHIIKLNDDSILYASCVDTGHCCTFGICIVLSPFLSYTTQRYEATKYIDYKGRSC